MIERCSPPTHERDAPDVPATAQSFREADEALDRHRHERLERMESWHFWFVGRRALVGGLLDRFATGDLTVRIVDIGCGTGDLSRELGRRGHSVVGVDLDPKRLSDADARTVATFVAGNATRLPLTSESVGAVTLMDVLEHVDDATALAEAARILQPGGLLLLTVPACPWLWSRRDDAAGHRRRYTMGGLSELLREGGFEILRTNRYQFLLFPAIVVSRLIARLVPRAELAEEHPSAAVNALLTRINLLEVQLGQRITWPWGSSIVAACRKPCVAG